MISEQYEDNVWTLHVYSLRVYSNDFADHIITIKQYEVATQRYLQLHDI